MLTLTLVLSLLGQSGDDPRPARPAAPPAQVRRQVYAVRYGPAADLATALARHYQGSPHVQIVPEPGSNSLLLAAPEDTLPEILRTLDQIDRHRQLVTVEVQFLTVAADKGPAELPAAGADLTAALDALKQKGAVATQKSLRVTGLEHQKLHTMEGNHKPTVSGASVNARGFAQSSVTYQNVGTTVTATARVTADRQIGLDLDVQDAGLTTPADGVPLGNDAGGKPLTAAEHGTLTVQTRLSLTPGQPVLVQDQRAAGKPQTLLVVTARLAEEGKAKK